MSNRKKRYRRLAILLSFALFAAAVPPKVSGEVTQITEINDKLEGISEEEKAVLEDLFSIQQEIDEIKAQADTINSEITTLKSQTKDLETQIDEKQEDYDLQLEVLKQVMVNYQRVGPASYLEVLLKADNLSEFLKCLNIIKDISHNVKELLTTMEDSKKNLEEERLQLAQKTEELEGKQEELQENLLTQQVLQEEQEDYLASLMEDRDFYQEQLDNINNMWTDSQTLFADIVVELNRIISSGYFTEEDMNLEFGFFTVKGYLDGETFNRILAENSSLTQTNFLFQEDKVVIEVPEKHLVLTGYFEIAGESAIQYVVTDGTFYDLPLEKASIDELFRNGPLLIDFNGITGNVISIDFEINEVWSEDGTLNFIVIPQF